MGKGMRETSYEIIDVKGIEEYKLRVMRDLVRLLPPGLSKTEVVLRTSHPWLDIEERKKMVGIEKLDPSVEEQLKKKTYISGAADAGR